MIIRANCKINIGLDIIARREDGFHDLETVMMPVVGLYDELSIDAAPETTFRGVGMEVDCAAEDNLCVRAARLMQSRYGVGGVSITLDKRIPFGAGLGGGSSDATAVLIAMNQLFGLSIPESELIGLAAELGSDTAFFVRNTPQYCTGRGEKMEQFDLDLSGRWLVLIKPDGVNVSTREAYSGVRPSVPQRSLRELLTLPIESWQGSVKNDFEPHIFRAYPSLEQIKNDLLAVGALYAAMSGSGSTIFGIFDSDPNKKSEQLNSYSPYIFEL
ncbi:MAG: 4-(cytidine 5'-diphospho)-2-C-methyl-D-erythritol kinase [Rikenellaceae bacterium]